MLPLLLSLALLSSSSRLVTPSPDSGRVHPVGAALAGGALGAAAAIGGARWATEGLSPAWGSTGAMAVSGVVGGMAGGACGAQWADACREWTAAAGLVGSTVAVVVVRTRPEPAVGPMLLVAGGTVLVLPMVGRFSERRTAEARIPDLGFWRPRGAPLAVVGLRATWHLG